jgi:hypothetical protein
MKKDRDIAAWLLFTFCVTAVLYMLLLSRQRSSAIEDTLKKYAPLETIKK